jgi:hypothetical protein
MNTYPYLSLDPGENEKKQVMGPEPSIAQDRIIDKCKKV